MSRPWTLEHGGQVVTDDDLINRDLLDIETLVGNGWLSADPWTGPTAALSIFATVVARRTGGDLLAVAAEISDLPAGTIMPAKRDIARKDDAPEP